jgi:adenylate cyclase
LTQSHTFLFADLAGFTAVTEAHGDERATALAFEFFEAVGDLVSEHRAERVKAIGDELMLRGEDAGQAVKLAVRVANEVGAQHGFPMIRIGLNTGPAVEREGDWFGSAVNLAARVASLAGGGEVLLTGATREAAGELAGIEWQTRGPRAFKNVAQQVMVFAALASERLGPRLVVDPVCRMALEPDRAAGRLSHRGVSYHFCSMRCAGAFAANTDHYAGRTLATEEA